MIPLIWLRGLVLAGTMAAIGGLGYTGYSKIKQIGYDEATAICELNNKERQALIDEKIRNIEVNSNVLIELQKVSNENLSNDIAKISKGFKGKTLTIVKNGECTPSATFSDSFNTINKRVNESLK